MLAILIAMPAFFGLRAAFTPVGRLTSVDCGTITGWVCDPADYSKSLSVIIYLEKKSNYLVAGLAGDSYDFPGADFCGGNKAHKFNISLPQAAKDGKTHFFYAYAINAAGNENAMLSGSPLAARCDAVSTASTTNGIKVACLGDSITVAYPVAKGEEYCGLLESYYGFDSRNFGISGQKSGQIAARAKSLGGAGFDYAVILAGTNDAPLLSNGSMRLEDTYANLSNIARALLDDGQRIVISTIPPGVPAINQTIVEINDAVRRVSYEKHICYADIYQKVFSGKVTEELFKYNDIYDGVHPNAVAQSKMAAVYNEAINNCEFFDCVSNPQDCYSRAIVGNNEADDKTATSSGTDLGHKNTNADSAFKVAAATKKDPDVSAPADITDNLLTVVILVVSVVIIFCVGFNDKEKV